MDEGSSGLEEALVAGASGRPEPSLLDRFRSGLAELGEPTLYIGNSIAARVGRRGAADLFYHGAQKGHTFHDQFGHGYQAGVRETAPSSPSGFDGPIVDGEGPGGGPPEAAAPVPLVGPSLAQLGVAGLGALLMPRFAAQALAAPFQAQLRQNAIDNESAAARGAFAAKALDAQADGLPARSETDGPGGATAGLGWADAPEDAPPSGLFGRRFGVEKDDRDLDEFRRRYLPLEEGIAISRANAEAESARRRAYDAERGLAGENRGSAKAWEAQLVRYEEAEAKTLSALSGVNATIRALVGQARALRSAFENPNANPEAARLARSEFDAVNVGLTKALTSQGEKESYLKGIPDLKAHALASAQAATAGGGGTPAPTGGPSGGGGARLPASGGSGRLASGRRFHL